MILIAFFVNRKKADPMGSAPIFWLIPAVTVVGIFKAILLNPANAAATALQVRVWVEGLATMPCTHYKLI